ncbi:MAG: PKD domain-containing protein [Chitinophagales bacterium]|nr:PKD domain-containing protein [Chitinophagaceae bacterium]MCB9065416.1 PKD domain-containing protein [Chitinophagales bacterium]
MNWKHLIYYIGFFVPFFAQAHSGDYSPIEFVKNEGQWDGPFVYRASFGNVDVFLENKTLTYRVGDKLNFVKLKEFKFGQLEKAPVLKYHVYKVHLLNANNNADISGSKARNHYYNYFLGNDQSKWKTGIHPELAVDYKNIYDGIDVHFASEGQLLKYDFIVNAGADASQIALDFEGVESLEIKDKNLIITTSVGEVHEMAPYAYQYVDGQKVEVNCKYKLKGTTVTYHFPRGYNETMPLIIDPHVEFSTFTGSTADNWGFTATYDDSGYFYAGGIAGGTGYPTTIGPTYGGGDAADGNGGQIKSDIAITKFNIQGTGIVYSTYIGGLSQDQPHSMVVDKNYNLFLTGRSYSGTYPSTNGSTLKGGADIIITKLNMSGAVTASCFVGGTGDDGVNISSVWGTVTGLKHSYGDDSRSEILADNNGNVYVASCTKSTDFPTANATKNTLTGTQDGVVIKMDNNLSSLIWSTYLGGNREDAAYVLAFNNAQSTVYVAGGTASSDMPTPGSTLWPSFRGGIADGYIVAYQNSGGYAVQRGTYIGAGGYDQVFGIQVDDADNVYVMGNTLGGGFPVTSGVYTNPNSSQFVMKLTPTLNTNVFSTVYGSGNNNFVNISPVAFLVDTCGNIYVSGWGGAVSSNGGNTNNMPVMMGNPAPTPAGILSSSTDGSDFHFMVFAKNATAMLFGAYFGNNGQADEHVDGGTSRFDKNGVMYQAICGGCGNTPEPTTANAYKKTNGSSNCNLLALKVAFNLGAVSAKAAAVPNAVVCLGEPVNFSSAGSSNVATYLWNFGDGNSSASANPSHTYQTGGTFTVKLIVNNPNACKIIDSVTLQVVVDTNSIKADFNVTQTDSCEPFTADITNLSKTGNTPNTASYYWDFGDGTDYTGKTPPTHTYTTKGTYTIKLRMTDPNACNSPDTLSKTISFNSSFVKAGFEGPDKTCVGAPVQFNNKSENAVSYIFDFGDGKSSTQSDPVHIFDSAGTYTIKMFAINTGTCNGKDSLERAIEVFPIPTASFTHDPIIPVTNDPVIFTNRSLNATSYIWDFGDGTGTGKETPDPKYYKKTGTYRVCLQALNSVGCSDTICRPVSADVYPLADVPNAFSPNGDGENDILYVRGSGIETLDFRIYNRWGQLVFETSDQSKGWDGTFNNKEQPMEAYAFVLNVTFIDGTTFAKKGNITLLR